MNKFLTILFVPIDGIGHVNACIGIAEALKERGHKIIFAISKSWNEKLVKYGFEEELMKIRQNSGPMHSLAVDLLFHFQLSKRLLISRKIFI
jgi:UDP:flavonoid glycosyltransferase YjiC (YdhE family)